MYQCCCGEDDEKAAQVDKTAQEQQIKKQQENWEKKVAEQSNTAEVAEEALECGFIDVTYEKDIRKVFFRRFNFSFRRFVF